MKQRGFSPYVLLLAGVLLTGPKISASDRRVSVVLSDTIVVQREAIDISKGVIAPVEDTVSVSVDPSAFDLPVQPVPGEIFKELSDRAVAPKPMEKKKTVKDFIALGNSLRRVYNFRDALSQFRGAASIAETIEERRAIVDGMRLAQNGANLMDYCTEPVVLARERFSLKEFFLFYPMKKNSWRSNPNPLDSLASPFVQATYVPKGEKKVYFSKVDRQGIRNLYYTEDHDTLWTRPALVDERLTSSGNEIYPVLSQDGKTMYFASDGLYGVGGYDLYYSTWDDMYRTWSEPQNMGFPFSSPGDDFLFYPTPDKKYTLFASNRACSKDSVYIYVLEFGPITKNAPYPDPASLRKLCALDPVQDLSRLDTGTAVQEEEDPAMDNAARYREASAEVSRLRDSIYTCERAIDDLRSELAVSPDRARLSERIAEQEALLIPLQDRLRAARKRVQDIEMAFLNGDIASDSTHVQRTADKEVVGAGSAYTFSKNSAGPRLRIKFAPPKKSGREPVFKIAPIGRFSPTLDLPSGVVYQIQIFSSDAHAGLDDLNGLSPVYERLAPSLKYVYSVGLFFTYADALANLNTVRRAGFDDAVVIAFRDGRQVSVQEARGAEERAARETLEDEFNY